MKKHIYIGLLLLFIAVFSQAQEKGGVFYVNGGGGLHTLQYDLLNGSRDNGYGFTVNAGYDYFFTPHWGIGMGVGIRSFQSEGLLNYMAAANSEDTDGESFEFRTYYNNWKEKQKALLIDIPVGFSYQTNISEKWGFLSTMGAKFSFPISATYQTTGGSIETQGYYPSTNAVLYGMPQHNFVTLTEMPDDDITLNMNTSVFLDLGVTRSLKENLKLYIGAYAAYGLSNAIDAKNQPVYQEDEAYNGILASQQTDKVVPVSVGLKVGLRWRKRSSEKPEVQKPSLPEKPIEEVVEEVPEAVEKVEKKPVVKTPVVEEKKLEPIKTVKEKKIVIYFKLASDTIIGKLPVAELKSLSAKLKSDKEAHLYIYGHTCDLGPWWSNAKIGRERANKIKQVMIELGAPVSQITAEGKLDHEPLVPNTSDENRAKNRRVELILE